MRKAFEFSVMLLFILALFFYNLQPTGMVTGTRSKLGIQTEFANSEAYSFVPAKPAVFKLMSNYENAVSIKTASPCSFIVARKVESQLDVGNGNPEVAAQSWFDSLSGTIAAYKDYIDCWEGANEPVASSPEAMSWLARYEKKRIELLAGAGEKACIGNFASGNPDLSLWPYFYSALEAAKQNGGYLALHEYSAPSMKSQFDESSGEGWLTGRYRKVYRNYLLPNGLAVPLLITEAGIDGGMIENCGTSCGWQKYASKEQYLEQLKWYDSLLKEDSYVVGAAIYAVGLRSSEWDSFDVSSLKSDLNSYINSVPAPEPPNCPVAEVPATGTLYGKVSDKGTGIPIQGATVIAGSVSATTGGNGDYEIKIPQGTYKISAYKKGYTASERDGIVVVQDQRTEVNFELELLAPPESCSEECGYIDSDGSNNDRICINNAGSGLRYTCSIHSEYGAIKNACDKFDALCLQNSYFSTWSECDAFGDGSENTGANGIAEPSGTIHNINGNDVICLPINDYYESWVQCGGSLLDEGILKQHGDSITDGATTYYCCSNRWQTQPCTVLPIVPPPTPKTKCGSACAIFEDIIEDGLTKQVWKGIGVYDKSEQCIEVKAYYNGKRCCIDKDCPSDEDCSSDGFCKPVARKECDSQGSGYSCMTLSDCKAIDPDARVVYGYCPSGVCCYTPAALPKAQQELSRIEIAPAPAEMKEGELLRFSAQAYDIKENIIYGLDYTWSAPPELGVMDNGLFQASSRGTGIVKASATHNGVTKEASAIVSVTAPRQADTFSISGKVTDTNNAPLSNARVEVLRVADETMVASSTTDTNGNYVISGIPAGIYAVIAGKSCYRNYGESIDLTGDLKADFRLQAPSSLDRVEIKPVSSITAVGQKIVFSAEAYDSGNMVMQVDFSWSTDDTSTGVIGSVDRIHGEAEFIGKKVGSTNIRATATCGSNSESASASANVLPAGTFVLKKCSEADATTSTKIDYVVLPDESYRNIEDFKSDIKTKYLPVLFSTSPIDSNNEKFNVYYYEERAKCSSTGICERPANLYKDCPFADLVGVIHVPEGMIPLAWRDYGVPGFFTAVTPRGQVHEIGHALFDFADEYCCNGAYFQSTKYPYHNIFELKNDCQKQLDDNAINKECEQICNCIGPVCLQCVDWYKQKDDSIMGDHTKTDKFSENGILRINWFFANAIR